MGGKKKLGLKQMERMQKKRDQESRSKDKKKEKAGPPKERQRAISVIPPDAKNERIVNEVKKIKVLTPYAVASKFNIRISAAKDFLVQLEQNGAVQLVSGNHNLKIYKSVAA
ncbi:MAG: hypothetical protein NWE80_03760 [Candidatus Bathyarchaeota archaeon]|nr:hypothetical protein [Candidatus Bathyarchaeota archaeon]